MEATLNGMSVLESVQTWTLLDDSITEREAELDRAVQATDEANRTLQARRAWQREFQDRARRGYIDDLDPTEAVKEAERALIASETVKRTTAFALGKLKRARAEAAEAVARAMTARGVRATSWAGRCFVNKSVPPTPATADPGRIVMTGCTPIRVQDRPPTPAAPERWEIEVIVAPEAATMG